VASLEWRNKKRRQQDNGLVMSVVTAFNMSRTYSEKSLAPILRVRNNPFGEQNVTRMLSGVTGSNSEVTDSGYEKA
jgi:hypothetical protein